MSIEFIVLEYISDSYQETSSSSLHSQTRYAAFNSFLYDNRRKDTDMTSAHSKKIIEMMENKCLGAGVSTI